MRKNPFTPNFGQVPYYLAGREFLIEEMLDAFEAGYGHPGLTSLFLGARGSGKTALLSSLANEAQEYGWIAVNSVCLEGLLEDVLQQAVNATSKYAETAKGRHLTGISIGSAFSLEWNDNRNDKPNWRSRMNAILDQLATWDMGLLITVDEVVPNLDEMIKLASVYQLFVREGRKVSLLMAGLPSHIADLVGNESVSFLRRASRYQLDRVEDYEVELAFTKTIEDFGKRISPEALTLAVPAADGFPYMIQLIGFRSWQEARDSEEIAEEHVEEGIRIATEDLRHRVLRATLDELSMGDLSFLAAMLEDEKESAVADLGRRLDKPSGYVARYRKRLIDRGVIHSPWRGFLRFGLPGLREYLPEYLNR